jgi:hypothetical protein
MVDLTDYVFEAGVFDAIGRVEIKHGMEGGSRKSPNHVLEAYIHTSRRRILNIFYKQFGGTIVGNKWYLLADDAASFLGHITDYLTVNYDAAMLGLSFQANKTSYRGKEVPTNELDMRWDYYKKMCAINSKINNE